MGRKTKKKKYRDPDAFSSETTFVPDPTLSWWESSPIIFGSSMLSLSIAFNMEYHSVESVAKAIQKIGQYQIQIFTLICILVCLTNVYSLSYVFTAGDLNYRCQIDECETNRAPYSNAWFRHSAPYDEKRNAPALCDRYARRINYTGVAQCGDEHYFDRDKIIRCARFIYETDERTALQEFNLQCDDNKWKLAMVGTIHCVGTLLNLFISGYLSDSFGRRTVLIGSVVGAAVGGILQSFSWSYASFVIFKFLQTLVGGGSYCSAMILGVELVQPQNRARIASLLFACSSMGYVILGVSAMYIPRWDTLLLVIFSPTLISLFYYWLIPESTKWLLTKERTSDLNKIIQRILKTNNIKISSDVRNEIEFKPELLFQESTVVEGQPVKTTCPKTTNVCVVLKYPAMMLRLAACSYCWITNVFIYYGLSLISVAIGGNKYTDFMAVQFIEVPACIFVMFISGRIGRKKILCTSFMIVALVLFAYTFIDGDVHWARLSIYLIGKFTITVAFSILFVYTSELMPTCLRQTLLSACSAFGRIGSMIAPQVTLLELIVRNSSMYLFAGTSLLAGIVCLQFPETLNTELPDTIEEAIIIGRTSSKK